MFQKLVFSAFGAGLVACVAVSLLQVFTTEPLILKAEVFETAGATAPVHDHDAGATAAVETAPAAAEAAPTTADAMPAGHHHDEAAWSPSEGFERTALTALANLVVAFAIALIILGAMSLQGEPIDARHGLVWGAAGFVAASLLPSLGLPPELPGTPSAELFARQSWWVLTAVASALGIFLILRGNNWPLRIAGAVLLIAPHIVGAPEAPSAAAAYPAVYAGEFAIASLVMSALLWSLSGLTAGWLHQRLSRSG